MTGLAIWGHPSYLEKSACVRILQSSGGHRVWITGAYVLSKKWDRGVFSVSLFTTELSPVILEIWT